MLFYIPARIESTGVMAAIGILWLMKNRKTEYNQYEHVSEKMKEKSAKLMENLIANLPSEAIEKHPFAAKMRQK